MTSYSVEDFHQMVANGQKLVILDDLILDVGEFMHEHPGGTFSISHNIGRDISKFFYGGYALENIDGKVEAHRHSISARKIVKQLIFGRLMEKARERFMKIEGTEDNGLKVSSENTVKTLKFVDIPNNYEEPEGKIDHFNKF